MPAHTTRGRPSRGRFSALCFTVGAALVAPLLVATSIAPTEAFWTDEEATGSDLYAGVVPVPQNVNCAINRPVARSHGPQWLNITWSPSATGPETVDVEGYRFHFAARPESPPPIQSPADIPGYSYTGFQDYLQAPGLRWLGIVREVVEYEIHLVSVGPGGWESDARVIDVRFRTATILRPGSSTCTVRPEEGAGSFSFQDDPGESFQRGLPPEEEEEALEEEPDDSTSVPSPPPTEEPASPEDALEGEDEFPEPEEPPTEEEPPESTVEQDTAEPNDDENFPERDGVPETDHTTGPEDPQR